VYVIFDQPTTVSMIKIWNYSKSPQRGAKDFAVSIETVQVLVVTLSVLLQIHIMLFVTTSLKYK